MIKNIKSVQAQNEESASLLMQQGRCAAISFLRSAMVSSGLHFTRIFRPIRSLQMTWHEQHIDKTKQQFQVHQLCTNPSSLQIGSKIPSYSIMLVQAVLWLASIMAEENAKGPRYCPCCKRSYKLEVQVLILRTAAILRDVFYRIIAVSTSFDLYFLKHAPSSWDQA